MAGDRDRRRNMKAGRAAGAWAGAQGKRLRLSGGGLAISDDVAFRSFATLTYRLVLPSAHLSFTSWSLSGSIVTIPTLPAVVLYAYTPLRHHALAALSAGERKRGAAVTMGMRGRQRQNPARAPAGGRTGTGRAEPIGWRVVT